MIQVLWVPGWAPARLNDLLGHPMKAARLKAKDRDTLARAALAHGARPAAGRRKVELHVVVPASQRRWDGDSMHKSLLDGLVAARLLRDDGPAWCVCGPVAWSRALDGGPWGAFILLEDL
jgi:hypothetical protein